MHINTHTHYVYIQLSGTCYALMLVPDASAIVVDHVGPSSVIRTTLGNLLCSDASGIVFDHRLPDGVGTNRVVAEVARFPPNELAKAPFVLSPSGSRC